MGGTECDQNGGPYTLISDHLDGVLAFSNFFIVEIQSSLLAVGLCVAIKKFKNQDI